MTLPRFDNPNHGSSLFGPRIQGSVKQTLDDEFFKEFSRALSLVQADTYRRIAANHSHFNPNQPRVPAGHRDGGQWTSTGGGSARPTYAEGSVSSYYSPHGQVMSDESPDPPRIWAQY